MITKIDLIQTLQNRLTGGDCPDDLKGQYHPQVLEQITQLVFSDVIGSDPKLMREVSIPYSLTTSLVSGTYEATLTVSPLQGSQSVLFVYGCDQDDWYTVIEGPLMNFMMNILKPGRCRTGVYYEQGKLKFTAKPHATVTAYVIPNISTMQDNDEIILPGQEAFFFNACFTMIRNMDVPRREILNNTQEDAAG